MQSHVAQTILKNRHPQTQAYQGETWPILTWTQPQGDCLSCSDNDDISIWTTWKKYRKRVRASCKLSKGSDWMETQMKRITDSHQDVWGHDHKVVRTEWKCTLAEDCTSFEMRRMTTRTDQLLYIAEATGSKIYPWEPEVESHSPAKVSWSCPWNSSMLVSLDFTRRGQPGQWWVSKAYTQVTPSSIQTYWQAWAWSFFPVVF